ncbi:hypothetical protein E0K89_011970, partial [Aquicoccus sp. SCR17]|nr:hypothetical protein [Carideicomes alvinocaridis]
LAGPARVAACAGGAALLLPATLGGWAIALNYAGAALVAGLLILLSRTRQAETRTEPQRKPQ